MRKKKTKFIQIIVAFLLCAHVLVACSGGGLEKKLPGTWKKHNEILTIYSDGTYEESGSYGTGRWTLLDGNVLKLTDFYGETETHEIEEISSQGITLKTGTVWEKADS